MSWAKVFELWAQIRVDKDRTQRTQNLITEQRKNTRRQVKEKKGVN